MQLHASVKKQLGISLEEFFPRWLELQSTPLDHRRVLTPERVGAYQISIEPYHGLNSGIRSMAVIPSNESIQRLRTCIEEFQPELLGYLAIPGQSMFIGDITKHVVLWCEYVEQKLKLSKSIKHAISNLISDLDNVLQKKEVTRELFAPVDGISLADDCCEIQIHTNLMLRKLTMSELEDLVSEDLLFSNGRSELFRSTSTVIISSRPMPINMENSEGGIAPLPLEPSIYDSLEALLASLHLLKSGSFSIIEYQHHFTPSILPINRFSVSSYRAKGFGPNIEINKADAEILKRLFSAYSKIEWESLKIAIRRLRDAESRMNPTDSLLDSIIGLEILLNPVERSELAFRVALHYAYLGDKPERKSRYELMRRIQETRNAIVHGGANIGSSKANEIANFSIQGKNCLREVILKFLIEGLVDGKKKINADFWLDFILDK